MARKPMSANSNGAQPAPSDTSGLFFVQITHEERGLVSSQYLSGAAEPTRDPKSNVVFLNYRLRCLLSTFLKVEFYLSQYRFSDFSSDGETISSIDVEVTYGIKKENRTIKFVNTFGICKLYVDQYILSVEIVNDPAKNANVILNTYQDQFDALHDRGSDPSKRGYRRKDQLPNPDKDHRAEANRNDAKFQTRISRDLSSRVDAFLRASGQTKSAFTEEALQRHLADHESQYGVIPPS